MNPHAETCSRGKRFHGSLSMILGCTRYSEKIITVQPPCPKSFCPRQACFIRQRQPEIREHRLFSLKKAPGDIATLTGKDTKAACFWFGIPALQYCKSLIPKVKNFYFRQRPWPILAGSFQYV